MPAYDPKRPRPQSGDAEEPAPVEALLDPEDLGPGEGVDEVVAEMVIEEVTVDEESGDVTVETTVIDEVVTSDGVVMVSETIVEELPGAALEVDLRDTGSNGSSPKPGSEVPVAAAPEEGTANRAVLIAGLSAAGLLAVVLAILLRRRRRAG
jgi:hypothetical protein